MKLRQFLAAAGASAVCLAATSAGAVTVSLPNQANQLNTATGQSILWDFDGLEAANTSFTGNVRSFPVGNITNSAPPPWDGGTSVCCDSGGNPYLADATNYASVQGGPAVSTFEILNGWYLTSFSFYMGSPDTYNSMTFHFVGGGTQVLSGDAIWGGGASGQAGNGDRTKGFRIYYDLEGAKVNKITFSSTTDAFEFDNLAGTLAVPEPTTWALMIMGFGGAGAMIRRRRAVAA